MIKIIPRPSSSRHNKFKTKKSCNAIATPPLNQLNYVNNPLFVDLAKIFEELSYSTIMFLVQKAIFFRLVLLAVLPSGKLCSRSSC